LQLFVRGGELLVGGFELFDRGLQVLLRTIQLGLDERQLAARDLIEIELAHRT
jgi:hypothetical protein